MKKSIIAIISIFFTLSLSFAFDWPKANTEDEDFESFFGILRGGVINNSLIFSKSGNVHASEEGKVLAIISEQDDESWFESTLGNAVIVAHSDNLLTVYGNLDNSMQFENTENVTKETDFGETGNSAWQKNDSFLEFQIADAKNNAYINPHILMPRIKDDRKLILTDVTLVGKNGKSYSLQTQRVIPAGTYKVYIRPQSSAMLYKSLLIVNGAEADTITYDTLKSQNGRLVFLGKDYYTKDVIYPNAQSQLAGITFIPHGKDTITITVSNILGEEKTLSYSITSY